MKRGSDSADRPVLRNGAEWEGVDCTPEMIAAGEDHLFRYHPEHGVSSEETVRRIFAAMLREKRGGTGESCCG